MSLLTLDAARQIIAATRAAGREQDLRPLSVAVLDAGGNLVAFEREDGSSTHRFQIAYGKAHGAIALGVGSRQLDTMARDRPHFIAAATAAIGGALVPVPGGVLVCDDDGVVIGAVGASGDTSDNDEAAIIVALQAVGLTPKID